MENLEKNADKLSFNFAVSYKNRQNNSYNYAKFAESLKIADFKKAIIFSGILNESQIENILKNPKKFAESKSKHDDFSAEHKKIRLFGQNELKICDMLDKKGIDTKVRRNNYKYITSFMF